MSAISLFDCPFCYEPVNNVLIKKGKKIIKRENKDGYFCQNCGIRIPESLINETMKSYEEKYD